MLKINKRNALISILLIVIAVFIDFIQYDLPINSQVYAIIIVVIFAVMALRKAISSYFLILFIFLLVFSDITRYLYLDRNFNSLYLGTTKYVILLISLLIGLKNNVIRNKKFLLFVFFLCIFFVVSVLKSNPFYYAVSDLVFYFLFFLLPYILTYIINIETGKKIIKIYRVYVTIYPIIVLVLLLLNRKFEYNGHTYIYMGMGTILNIGYLVGEIEKGKKILKKVLLLFLYIAILLLSPSSGDLLLLVVLTLYLIVMKSNKIKSYLKVNYLLIVLILAMLIPVGFHVLESSNMIKNPFLKYKIMQINSLWEIRDLDRLPFSVQVRVAEMLNVINSNFNIDLVFGKGFGGYYLDSKNLFPQLDETAFTKEEITSGKYYQTHFFLSEIFLKFGVVGICLLFFHIVYVIKVLRKNYKEFIPTFIVVVYSSIYGVRILFIWAFILGSVLVINRIKRENYRSNF